MIVFMLDEIFSIIIIAVLLIASPHLRRRDTAESNKIFGIAVLTLIGAVVNLVALFYTLEFVIRLDDKWLMVYIFFLSLLCCLKEMMSLQIAISWTLFVDYGIYKSQNHVIKRFKQFTVPCVILSIIFVFLFTIFDTSIEYSGVAASITTGFSYLCVVFQILLCIYAIKIVLSAKKRRLAPSFLRLDVFLVPFVLGYVLLFIPMFVVIDFRSICTAIAVVLTWQTVRIRYKYMDPYTGFYRRTFLSDMNDYMEKSGYPNGIGVYFKADGSNGKLAAVLDGLKPADSEIFSLGKDEYLLVAGPQKESVIRLLIKSVKLKAAEADDSLNIETSYSIREDNESAEAFSARLLEGK